MTRTVTAKSEKSKTYEMARQDTQRASDPIMRALNFEESLTEIGVHDDQQLEHRNHSRRVLLSSKDMTWETPQNWYDYLNLEFKFTLDPCCLPETAKCKKFYTPEDDGLAQSWRGERVFMNPPYGRELSKWMRKAYEEARDSEALVVCLVPARVDTLWWHAFAMKASDIRFPVGRLTFAGADAPAPFPVAIVIFRPRI